MLSEVIYVILSMLSNYLNLYSEALRLTQSNRSRILLVDIFSRFQFISSTLANENNMKERDLLNKTYIDLPAVSDLALNCISEDKCCLETLRTLNFITTQTYNQHKKLFHKSKTPIFTEDQSIVGIKIEFTPIYLLDKLRPVITSHLLRFNQSNIQLHNPRESNINLTDEEALILFLLLIYGKPKLVAQYVNHITQKSIAVSTVRNIIYQQLFRKFMVINLQELIDKAISMKYETIVPKLIDNNISILYNE